MRCARCGNEVSQEEAFCGHCGAPNTPPPTQIITPPSQAPGRGLLRSYRANAGVTPPPIVPQPPPDSSQGPQPTHPLPQPGNLSATQYPPHNPPSLGSVAPHQQDSFYHEATEAISMPSNRPGQSSFSTYPQLDFPGTSPAATSPATGQYAPPAQPFQTDNYRPAGYPPQPLTSGPQYGAPLRSTPPPQKQRSGSSVLLIVGICCVVALISVVGLATFFLTRNQPGSQQAQAPKATVAPTATTIPPTATPLPTATALPTAVPTPAPDPGFTWCGQSCATYGFATEYPGNWHLAPISNASGVQFINAVQPDQFAAIKAMGPTASSAGDLVSADIQANFAVQPGYVAPTTTATATISGETWLYALTYYQSATNQRERVVVYGTVHQGKGYIIELQAPDLQFDLINQQAFINITGKFQFIQGAP